jgi:hypothetical protein
VSKPNHGKAAQEQLENLHGTLAEVLAAKIKSGDVTAADLSVARQFLKDNGIDAIPTGSNPIGDLAKIVPFQTNNEETESDSE